MDTIALIQVGVTIMAGMGMGVLFARHWRDLVEALNNWRGGPPPTHPLPGDDGVIVLRGRRAARPQHGAEKHT
jgi:hypothetical protein